MRSRVVTGDIQASELRIRSLEIRKAVPEMGLWLGARGQGVPSRSGRKRPVRRLLRMRPHSEGRPLAVHPLEGVRGSLRRGPPSRRDLLQSHSPLPAGTEHAGQAGRPGVVGFVVRTGCRIGVSLGAFHAGLYLSRRPDIPPSNGFRFVRKLPFFFRGRTGGMDAGGAFLRRSPG